MNKAWLWRWLVVPAALAALLIGQAWWMALSTCETYDEFTYMRLGICLYRHADFPKLASPMCPPLPILLEYALPGLLGAYEPDEEGYEGEVAWLMRLARLETSVVIGAPLVWTVYAWLTRRRGWTIGALGGLLTALSPTVLAAAAIATTDACFALFALIALGALRQYQADPTRGRLLRAGAAMGLAMASKQSAVCLFPVAGVEVFLAAAPRREGETPTDWWLRRFFGAGLRLAALVVVTFTVDEALYGFGFAPSWRSNDVHMTLPVVVPMLTNLLPNGDALLDGIREFGPPLALDTFYGQLDHATSGHAAFLMGMRSMRGWWYFFPVAIAIKSTPTELILFAVAFALALRPSTWRDPTRRIWLGALLVMLALGMASRINIGQRYMLLTYPLVILLGSDALASFRRGGWLGPGPPDPGAGAPDGSIGRVRTADPTNAAEIGATAPDRGLEASPQPPRRGPGRLALPLAAAVLLLGQAASNARVAPYYLCYFNMFIGGPLEGYRYLADSSLDWGQDLPVLRRALEARGYRKVALAAFGTASAKVYGLRSIDLTSMYDDPFEQGCDWLAISATRLQGVYTGKAELLDLFGPLPHQRAGFSFFLYDLRDPRVQAAVHAARAVTRPAGESGTPPN